MMDVEVSSVVQDQAFIEEVKMSSYKYSREVNNWTWSLADGLCVESGFVRLESLVAYY